MNEHTARSAPSTATGRASLRDRALEELRLAIATGEIGEGTCYSAAALARDLGISLSPVREAMMSLVAEGTVEAVPNRGFRLVPVTWDDLEEIIRIRTLLARPAAEELARRAAVRGDARDDAVDGHLGDLCRYATAAVDAVHDDDFARFDREDREFHRALLGFGLGSRAADISLRLRDQSRIPGTVRPPRDADISSAQALNGIVDALAAGDPVAAADRVEENLYYFRKAAGSAT